MPITHKTDTLMGKTRIWAERKAGLRSLTNERVVDY